MEELQQILQNLGLTTKEAALYSAALNLGDAPMSVLAKEARLKRSTAYQVFKALADRGFMGSYKRRGGLHFSAVRPERLFRRQKEDLQTFETALSKFAALGVQGDRRARVSYYEGSEGYLRAVEDSLDKPNNLLRHIGSLTESHKTMGRTYDLTRYLPARVKQNIRLRCLYFSDLEEDIQKRDHARELREIRYLPEQFWFKGSSLIYDDKVVIVGGAEEMMTVVIESPTIAQAEKQKFDLLWELSAPTTFSV